LLQFASQRRCWASVGCLRRVNSSIVGVGVTPPPQESCLRRHARPSVEWLTRLSEIKALNCLSPERLSSHCRLILCRSSMQWPVALKP
jgi:hypothetical protein